MLDHKPGKGAHTHSHAAGGPEPHAGKQSRVEQELGAQDHAGPIATAADTTTSATVSSDYASFHRGNVFVSESVSATLSHGKGPVKTRLQLIEGGTHNAHTYVKGMGEGTMEWISKQMLAPVPSS